MGAEITYTLRKDPVERGIPWSLTWQMTTWHFSTVVDGLLDVYGPMFAVHKISTDWIIELQ